MSHATAPDPADIEALAKQLESDFAAGSVELPLLPNVAAEVLSSSLDDHADAARLAELIQQDQALASHVLRVVNSPAFRGAIEIVALQQAIARLGMERIREIALSASLKGALFKKGSYQALADECWQIALASGLWAKEIARACRKNVELAYLSGLLHNIGAPLLLHRLGELAPELARDAVEALLDRVGQQAGAALADAWQLPPLIGVTIRHINDFGAAGEHADAVAVAATGAALGRWMCTRGILIAEVNALPSTQHLGLYPDDVVEVLERADAIRESLESMST